MPEQREAQSLRGKDRETEKAVYSTGGDRARSEDEQLEEEGLGSQAGRPESPAPRCPSVGQSLWRDTL